MVLASLVAGRIMRQIVRCQSRQKYSVNWCPFFILQWTVVVFKCGIRMWLCVAVCAHVCLYEWGKRGGGGQKEVLAAAAAKSLQSCPTMCDPIDGSPLGSSVPGILQARTLEWVVISFSKRGPYLVAKPVVMTCETSVCLRFVVLTLI